MIADYIHFIDRNLIEKQLYWMVPHVYDKRIEFEVQWAKGERFSWRYRRRQASFWTQVKSENLIAIFTRENIDLVHFEEQLRQNILQQAVYSNDLFNRIRDLMGVSAVDNALSQHELFFDQLREVVEKLTLQTTKNEQLQKIPPLPNGSTKSRSEAVGISNEGSQGTTKAIKDHPVNRTFLRSRIGESKDLTGSVVRLIDERRGKK